MGSIVLDFDQVVALGMFALGIMGFWFGILKFFSVQAHSRISKLEKEVKARLDHIEENYARRVELTGLIGNIRDILDEMKTEYRRVNDRMDDMFKWMVNTVKGSTNDKS